LRMAALLLLCGPALAPAGAANADDQHGFLNRMHKDADGKEAKYAVFVPYDYKGDKPCPLILFLHSSSERGDDGQKQGGPLGNVKPMSNPSTPPSSGWSCSSMVIMAPADYWPLIARRYRAADRATAALPSRSITASQNAPYTRS
jgi:hypothetical protein